jgi:porphobilinogen deaminase
MRLLGQHKIAGFICGADTLVHCGLANQISEFFPTDYCIPPANQGISVVMVRTHHAHLLQPLKRIDHPETRLILRAETQFMHELLKANNHLAGACYTALIQNQLILNALGIDSRKDTFVQLTEKADPTHVNELIRQLVAHISKTMIPG